MLILKTSAMNTVAIVYGSSTASLSVLEAIHATVAHSEDVIVEKILSNRKVFHTISSFYVAVGGV